MQAMSNAAWNRAATEAWGGVKDVVLRMRALWQLVHEVLPPRLDEERQKMLAIPGGAEVWAKAERSFGKYVQHLKVKTYAGSYRTNYGMRRDTPREPPSPAHGTPTAPAAKASCSGVCQGPGCVLACAWALWAPISARLCRL